MELRPNMKVRYKANPGAAGWLIDIDGESARIFIDGSPKLVPLSELEAAPVFVELSPEAFRVALTRRRLEHPLTEQLLSYKASRTQLYYHQFLPVKKIIESPDQRLLIADEVGTGKTIEAGLIWAELEARMPHGLENVWVICPKSLVGKWQEEMLQRFDLRLEPLSPEGLRQALAALDRDGILPPRFAQAVVNLELIRNDEYVSRLGASGITWDFVVFDEAHHLRNPETLSHGLARFICERTRSAVFLTATPLQTGIEDIVHLMEALGVDVASDRNLLQEQIQWEMGLNDWVHMVRQRPPDWERRLTETLDRLEDTGGRERPGWKEFRGLVNRSDLSDLKQRTEVIHAARDVQVLSPYMTRSLRADVDLERPTREAVTRVVEFNDAESRFYQEVYRTCLERARAAGVPPGFATQMPERRTASCAPAVAAEILSYAAESEDEEHEARFTASEVRALEPSARAVIGTTDSKFEALLEILSSLFTETGVDRAMVFSTFRGTLGYLANRLRDTGYTLETVHGEVPARDEDCRPGEKSRERIALEFRRGDFKLLLASEVAGEGLDFEHCSVVINYDLPWNPMRVEQRIGRCDRIGQKSQKIHVGNLASVGTIEERILSRLYQRLRIFERALGDMEMVLGEQIANFEREVFTAGLSAQQMDERLARIEQAVVNLEQQREGILEASELFLAGRQLLESDQQEIRDVESQFLSADDLAEFVVATVETKFPGCLKRAPRGTAYEMSANQEVRDMFRGLLRAYPAASSARTEIARFAHRLDDGSVRLTFAEGVDDGEFVHVRHPLVLLARWLARDPLPDKPFCRGAVAQGLRSAQLLMWAIASLEGYTTRAELLCVSVDCETGIAEPASPHDARNWLTVLQAASSEDGFDWEAIAPKAEQQLLTQFKELTSRFNTRNEILAEKARKALVSQAERRLNWLRRQLSRTDLRENIRNMYRGWSNRIESETRSEIEQMDAKRRVRSSLQTIGVAVILPKDR